MNSASVPSQDGSTKSFPGLLWPDQTSGGQGKVHKLALRLPDKVEFVVPMIVVSILPHAEFGPNDHREDAPHFSIRVLGSPIHYCNSDKN